VIILDKKIVCQLRTKIGTHIIAPVTHFCNKT